MAEISNLCDKGPLRELYLQIVQWLYDTGVHDVYRLPSAEYVVYDMSNSTLERTLPLLRKAGILGFHPDGSHHSNVFVVLCTGLEVKDLAQKHFSEGPSIEELLGGVAHMAGHLFISVGTDEEGIQFDTHPRTDVHGPLFTRLEVMGYCFKEGQNYIWSEKMRPVIDTMWN